MLMRQMIQETKTNSASGENTLTGKERVIPARQEWGRCADQSQLDRCEPLMAGYLDRPTLGIRGRCSLKDLINPSGAGSERNNRPRILDLL